MIYQIDPVSPFTQAQKDALVVDSIKLPRDTLSRGTGDCDDLTVLYCSLLEAAGIETGFITVPGHIFPAVNTGYRGRQFGELHPDRRMTIDVDGELWLPVEITMVAAGQFLDAWYRGADLWHNFDETPESRGFYRTRTSQAVYRPVGLRESDLGLQYGDPQALASVFRTSLADIGKIVTEGYSRTARESGREQDYNRAGMIYAKFGFYREAESYLEKALHISPDYVPALINRGNIAYMRENFSRALEDYRIAYDNLSSRGLESSSVAARLLINMSKTSYAAGEHNQAQTLYVQAQELEPQLASSFAYLGSAGGFSRASDLSESENIFFIEE